MTKQQLLDIFYNNPSKRLTRKYKDLLTDDITHSLNMLYPDSLSVLELLYRLKYDIVSKPLCKTCKQPLVFISSSAGYGEYCSKECMYNSPEVKNKRKKTCLEKYGNETYNNLDLRKQTCQEKYGVDTITQSEHFKKKYKETCFERYGVYNVSQNENIKRKQVEHTNYEKVVKHTKETCLLKYGKCSTLCLDNIRLLRKSPESIKREYQTKKLHHTHAASNAEIEIYNILKEQYADIIQHYFDTRYPFNCDYYIPSKDLFIEYQGFWTHGKHPFNPESQEDINTLNLWKEHNTPFYENAIQTWTIRDPHKRVCAYDNKLRYIEIWPKDNIEDIINVINSYPEN